ncbi:MAG: hypothetical protein KDA92_19995, partial [Planctomycetales bacterium]|nr:hypothetical protein [Planctomycetales bacterium]
LRKIRGDYPQSQTLFVAVTGFGREEDRRQTEEAGFHLHVVKPVDPYELLETIAQRQQRDT